MLVVVTLELGTALWIYNIMCYWHLCLNCPLAYNIWTRVQPGTRRIVWFFFPVNCSLCARCFLCSTSFITPLSIVTFFAQLYSQYLSYLNHSQRWNRGAWLNNSQGWEKVVGLQLESATQAVQALQRSHTMSVGY